MHKPLVRGELTAENTLRWCVQDRREHRGWLTSAVSFHGVTGNHCMKGGAAWNATGSTRAGSFERTSKRRRGFPSEMRVKRGARGVSTPLGFKDFVEKLGRRDLCPCGSGKLFQDVLPDHGPVLTART